MTCGVAVNLYVRFGTPIAWTWYVVIGSSITIATALAASAVLDRESAGARNA
jgi:hypothetical protein